MKTNPQQSDAWHACHGEVGYLVRHLKNRRRSAAMQRGVAGAFILLLGLYTSYFHVVVMADIDLHSGDLACDWVMPRFHQFFAGMLDDTTDAKFRRHLDHCHACRSRLMEHLRARQQGDTVSVMAPDKKTDELNTQFVREADRPAAVPQN